MSDNSGSFLERIDSYIKSGKLLPALCNVVGVLLFLFVIATALPLSVPRLLGYEVFDIISGSMEPEIPVGSVVYSRYVDPATIKEGDIIVFRSEESIVTHRVVRNNANTGEFVTKGDANANQDPAPVSYKDIIGKVVYHFPAVGSFLSIYASPVGKFYLFMIAASGMMFNLLAGRIRISRGIDKRQKMSSEDERIELASFPKDSIIPESAVTDCDEILAERRENEKAHFQANGKENENGDETQESGSSSEIQAPIGGDANLDKPEKVRKILFDFRTTGEWDDPEPEKTEENGPKEEQLPGNSQVINQKDDRITEGNTAPVKRENIPDPDKEPPYTVTDTGTDTGKIDSPIGAIQDDILAMLEKVRAQKPPTRAEIMQRQGGSEAPAPIADATTGKAVAEPVAASSVPDVSTVIPRIKALQEMMDREMDIYGKGAAPVQDIRPKEAGSETEDGFTIVLDQEDMRGPSDSDRIELDDFGFSSFDDVNRN